MPETPKEILSQVSVAFDVYEKLIKNLPDIMIRTDGTLRNITPYLKPFLSKPLIWVMSIMKALADNLQKDLSDTEETRQATLFYLQAYEKYANDLKNFVITMKGNTMPKALDMINQQPTEPFVSKDTLINSISKQNNFVMYAIAFSIFAVPSFRYSVEQRMSYFNKTISRSLASDFITIAAYALLTSAVGKLFIKQKMTDGAFLGAKISFILLCIYETARLTKHTLTDSGATEYIRNIFGRSA